jgi:hypothetical protein
MLTHTHRRTDEQTGVTMLIVRFLKPLLDVRETWIFQRNFRKLATQIYKLFSSEEQTESGTDIINRISQFRYAITNVLHIYRRPAKFLAFLQTVEPISYYFLSGQSSYTLSLMTDTNTLGSESTNFKYHVEILLFHVNNGYAISPACQGCKYAACFVLHLSLQIMLLIYNDH